MREYRLQVLLAVACFAVLAALSYTALTWPWINVAPTIWCSEKDTENATPTILIIGDSWATHTEIGSAFIHAEAEHGRHIRVCQIGYPGLTAARIASSIDNDRQLISGISSRASTLIVIAGLNDVAGHFGARSYTRGISRILGNFPNITHAYVVETPPYSPKAVGTSAARVALHRFRSCLVDTCAWNTLSLYRTQMHLNKGGAVVVPISPFLPSYQGHERDYVDGLHLTTSMYGRLGRYLQRAILTVPQNRPNLVSATSA